MITSYNPFDAIEKRLSCIEQLLATLNIHLPKPEEQDVDAIIGVDEVAKMLHLSKHTVYTYTHKKIIPHWKVGKKLLFSRNRILAFISKCEVQLFHEELKSSERIIKDRINKR